MTFYHVLWRNLRRNPLRTGLTAVAFALPMAVFVAAISLVVVLIQIGKESEKQLRLAVHNKVTLINLMPQGMRTKIEALDTDHRRLEAVCGMRWFGGRVPNTQNTITSLAADADTFPTVYTDVGMTEEEVGAWKRDPRACVIGQALAHQYRWGQGDRITLESTVPPYLSLEFRVVKITDNASRSAVLYLRHDYLEESLKAQGLDEPACNIFWVKCKSLADLHALQGEVDALFANSPNETKSEDENAFAAGFTQAMGDLPGLMRAMAIVVVFIIALVAGNTMMMSFRERTKELAVFKAIGFSRRRVFVLVMGESILLALLGALMGVIPTSLILMRLPPGFFNFGPIGVLTVSPVAIAGSIMIALAVGLAAGLWPAYQALRLNTVDALRKAA